jgi:hypothetical protein
MIVNIAFCLQCFDDSSVNGLQLAVAVSAADDEVIRERAGFSGIQQDYVCRLLVCRYLNNPLGQFNWFE